MPHTEESYKQRAEECVRLANATEDPILRGDILRLRQKYLSFVRSLGGSDPHRSDGQ